MRKSAKFSPEVQERAVRMVLEHWSEHDSQWAAIRSISAKFGCTAETLRRWVRQAERDRGLRPGTTTADAERLKQLERENRELRQANEILRKARVSSTRRRNGLAQLSGWRLEAQGLTRSFVETSGDLVQECLRMAG